MSDQGRAPAAESPVVQLSLRVIKAGSPDAHVEWFRRAPSLGIAEQRDFLLKQSYAEHGYISTMTC